MNHQLRLYNTLTRRVQPFRSLVPGKVKMFVCGPTIQDYIHLGHARTYLFYDMLARYLSYVGYSVSYLVNITDVDEGIVKGAKARGLPLDEFTSKYEQGFLEDVGRLGIRSVSSFDRVTSHIPEMIQQVQGLLDMGHAYRVGGSVYFSVDTFPSFGQLSHQTPEEISLRPLEINAAKRNQADFSLWREGSEDEQKWEGPWGYGTPGWHVQDTAVSQAYFGLHYDIHGGARELIYPHHEAQIAQMEALSGERPFVRFWVHSGLLTQSKEKMAKSRGNAPRVRELLKDYDAGAFRLYFLSMHHRKDAEFNEFSLKSWGEKYDDLLNASERILRKSSGRPGKRSLTLPFVSAMNDDLQAGEAIRYLVKVVKDRARQSGSDDAADTLSLLQTASSVLGVDMLVARR